MTCVTEEKTATAPNDDKGPFKKRVKPCIICGKPSDGVTSYLYRSNGTSETGMPFCLTHLVRSGTYATPVFEDQVAFDRFKREHPILYNRYVVGRKILILTQLQAEGASAE